MDQKILVVLATKSPRLKASVRQVHKEIHKHFVYLSVFESSWQKLCLSMTLKCRTKTYKP